jgi:hypothetical protein
MQAGALHATQVVIQSQVRARLLQMTFRVDKIMMSAELVLAVGTQKLDRSRLRSMCASHAQPAHSE